ncbi:MAG: flavin reductase [Alphaproteobacteria bacterium]|nr:flavin reductase [Alphaproteobacteria bacterium]
MVHEVDPYRRLKDAFARYATGVAIATCAPPGRAPAALTVNSFTSVSLNPSLVLWSLQRSAGAYDAFMAADNYAISVLRAGQEATSTRFATRGAESPTREEFETWATGAPVLRERLAGFDCRISARHDAGDHVILVGEVLQFDSFGGKPLLYYASGYATGPDVAKAAAD